jgi:hypothetical protein
LRPAEAGRIYAMEAGKSISYDDDLGTGWRHLVVVREKGRLRLYLDGKECVASEPFDGEDYPLTNRASLFIGKGPQSNFSGSLADLRVYGGALSAVQVAELHRTVSK